MIVEVPPPSIHCIAAASPDVNKYPSRLLVSGLPEKIAAMKPIIAKKSVWQFESSTGGVGVEMITFIAAGAVQYRDVGELIFEAQQRRLAAALLPSVPICKMLKK